MNLLKNGQWAFYLSTWVLFFHCHTCQLVSLPLRLLENPLLCSYCRSRGWGCGRFWKPRMVWAQDVPEGPWLLAPGSWLCCGLTPAGQSESATCPSVHALPFPKTRPTVGLPWIGKTRVPVALTQKQRHGHILEACRNFAEKATSSGGALAVQISRQASLAGDPEWKTDGHMAVCGGHRRRGLEQGSWAGEVSAPQPCRQS